MFLLMTITTNPPNDRLFTKYLLWVRHGTRYLIFVIPLIHTKKSMLQSHYYILICRWESWGLKILANLPKDI